MKGMLMLYDLMYRSQNSENLFEPKNKETNGLFGGGSHFMMASSAWSRDFMGSRGACSKGSAKYFFSMSWRKETKPIITENDWIRECFILNDRRFHSFQRPPLWITEDLDLVLLLLIERQTPRRLPLEVLALLLVKVDQVRVFCTEDLDFFGREALKDDVVRSYWIYQKFVRWVLEVFGARAVELGEVFLNTKQKLIISFGN